MNKNTTPLNLKFFSIGFVSEELDIPQHVLRFWESQFDSISPIKRNGRRLYSEKDIEKIKMVKNLLYSKKYTIEGAKKHIENYETSSEPEAQVMQENMDIEQEITREEILKIVNKNIDAIKNALKVS